MAPDAGPSNLVSPTDTDGDIEIKKLKIDVTKWVNKAIRKPPPTPIWKP